jgi:hypothetical protein
LLLKYFQTFLPCSPMQPWSFRSILLVFEYWD